MRFVVFLIICSASVFACSQTYQIGKFSFDNTTTYIKSPDNVNINQSLNNTLNFNYIDVKMHYLNEISTNHFYGKNNRLISFNYKGVSLNDYMASDGVKNQSAFFTSNGLNLKWNKSTTPLNYDATLNTAIIAPKGYREEQYGLSYVNGKNKIIFDKIALNKLNSNTKNDTTSLKIILDKITYSQKNIDTLTESAKQYNVSYINGKNQISFDRNSVNQVGGLNKSDTTLIKINIDKFSIYQKEVNAIIGNYKSYGANYVTKNLNMGYNNYSTSEDYKGSIYNAADAGWSNYLKGKTQSDYYIDYKDNKTQVFTDLTSIANEQLSKIDAKELITANTQVETKYAEYKNDQKTISYSDIKFDTQSHNNQYSVTASHNRDQNTVASNNSFPINKFIAIKTNAVSVNNDLENKTYLGFGLGLKFNNFCIDVSQLNQYTNIEVAYKYKSGDVKISHYDNMQTVPNYINTFGAINSNPTSFNIFSHYLESYSFISFNNGNKFSLNQNIPGAIITFNYIELFSPNQEIQRMDLNYKTGNMNVFCFKEALNSNHSNGFGAAYSFKSKSGNIINFSLSNKWNLKQAGWLGNITASFSF